MYPIHVAAQLAETGLDHAVFSFFVSLFFYMDGDCGKRIALSDGHSQINTVLDAKGVYSVPPLNIFADVWNLRS